MENKNTHLFLFSLISLLVGVTLGAGFMYIDPLQIRVDATQSVQQTQIAKTFSYTGVVSKISDTGFSMYSGRGDLYEVTFDNQTKFAEIVGKPPYTYVPTTSSALKVNYYAYATFASYDQPLVATSVAFRVFQNAPFPYVPKLTPAPTPTPVLTSEQNPAPAPVPVLTPEQNPAPAPAPVLTPEQNPAPAPALTPEQNPAPAPALTPESTSTKTSSASTSSTPLTSAAAQ